MNIALLGYGKMGKAIEEIAVKKGHTIVVKKGRNTSFEELNKADVAIDFSLPEAAVTNISYCLKNNIPIVSGTTGWLNKYDDMVALCKEQNGSFIYSSNYSLGVTIFFELNNYLAKMMRNNNQYSAKLKEIHHTQKLDAPSGTAISLANGIIANSDKYNNWTLQPTSKKDEIPIKAERIDNVPGTHNITYKSDIDTITIQHTAHNRKGFALGAVTAAEWLLNKKGIFTMRDVLFKNENNL